MAPRVGIGQALQAKPDYAQAVTQQIRRGAQRNRNALDNLRKQQSKAQQAVMEDFEGIDKDIHPVYNPVIENIKQDYFSKVSNLKKKNPATYTKTPHFKQITNETKRKLQRLKQSSDNYNFYKEKGQKEGYLMEPDVIKAFANQDLGKLQEVTGNEYGLFGGVPMRDYSPSGLNRTLADNLGMNETLEGLQSAGGFRQIKEITEKRPDAKKFEQALRSEYLGDTSLQRTAKEKYGVENVDDFVDLQLQMIPSEKRVSTKRMPDRDEGGDGGGREQGRTIFGGMQATLEQSQPQIVEALKNNQATGQDIVKRLADITKTRNVSVGGTDAALEYEGVGEGKAKIVNASNVYTKIDDEGGYEQTINEGGTKYGSISEKGFGAGMRGDSNLAMRVQDIKFVLGYYEDGNVKIATKEDLNNPDIAGRVQMFARMEGSLLDPGDNASDISKNVSELKDQNINQVIEYRPLGQRGVAESMDDDFYRANEYFSEGGGMGIGRNDQQGNQNQQNEQDNPFAVGQQNVQDSNVSWQDF